MFHCLRPQFTKHQIFYYLYMYYQLIRARCCLKSVFEKNFLTVIVDFFISSLLTNKIFFIQIDSKCGETIDVTLLLVAHRSDTGTVHVYSP